MSVLLILLLTAYHTVFRILGNGNFIPLVTQAHGHGVIPDFLFLTPHIYSIHVEVWMGPSSTHIQSLTAS